MNFVAVTSCPTGIAHSQMAAENLEQTATRLGHEIRVEIQGAMGTEDELGADEIADADAVIIAADTSVDRTRFEEAGVPVVKGGVKEGVNDAEGLIEEAEAVAGGDADGDAPSTGTGTGAATGEQEREVVEDTPAAGSDSEDASEPAPERVGGDPRKGLFARLKRLLG
jgi:PTS system fructose-specific IIB component